MLAFNIKDYNFQNVGAGLTSQINNKTYRNGDKTKHFGRFE